MEKSPPNLLRLRLLQAVFPDAAFVVIVRHPVAVAYATQFWAKTPPLEQIEHWLIAHETFEQ
ncbi:sulfotransferase, partial [Klebsiella pneumoniae]|nr:sulfotransferase [Klebsiella pneumoniae]